MTKLLLLHKIKPFFKPYGENFTKNSKCSFEYASQAKHGYMTKSGFKVKYGNMYCVLFALGIL